MIFEAAASTDAVGALEETLKWGEPACVTAETGTGTTIRIDWKKVRPLQYAMYFNCRTSLVQTFRTLFPAEFRYEGNRAIVFDVVADLPKDSLAFCIGAALVYHRRKKGPWRHRIPNQ